LSFIIKNGYQKSAEESQRSSNFDYWREVVSDEYVQLECHPQPGQNVADFNAKLRGGIGFSDVSFSEVVSKPQIAQRTQRHVSKASEDDFLISFQVENQCRVRQYGREALLVPGSFALYSSTTPYTLSFKEDFHQFVIQMPRDVLARHLIEPEKYAAITMNANAGLGLVLKDFIFSLAGELSTEEVNPSEVLSENLVSLIALSFSSTVMQSGLIDTGCAKEILVRRIKNFVESNSFSPGLNNKRIAESQGISVRYLNKLFQDQDESIHEMIVNKRLSTAKELLSSANSTKPTIESVAYRVGFSDASHFSRAFKMRYGICPSSVR